KPKSQVCLFAKREHRASAGANIARPDVPSGTSLSVPLFKNKDEKDIYHFCVTLAVLPPRAAGRESKKACFPFLLKISSVTRCVALGKSFCCCVVRISFMFAFFFKMRTQSLNM
ncbi:MAG: hypothetical protein IKC97_04845, partial [Clostridia bacterium]|nr:hypothetical protein [Clostridia bacterium]